MKSRILPLLLPGFVFLFFACSKEVSEEHGSIPTNISSGNFTATIDGTPWTADSLQQALVLDNNGSVNISGLGKTGEQISMILPVFKKGSYILNSTSSGYSFYLNLQNNTQQGYLSNVANAGGTVTISTIDTVNKTVSGTFQFNLTSPVSFTSRSVTKGVFTNIPYISATGPVPPPGGIQDTLLATVDGAKFNAIQVLSGTSGNQLTLAGFGSNGAQSVDLIMPESVGVGTYNLDVTAGVYAAAYSPDGLIALLSVSNGSLTILMNDIAARRIRGTFSFVGSETGVTSVNIT